MDETYQIKQGKVRRSESAPPLQIIIHADDFGASRGVTDTILDAFDNGRVFSTSVLANGHAYEYAIGEYKKRPGMQLGIHLNLVEGVPVLSSKNVSLLINQEGRLYHSFFSLWKTFLSADIRKQDMLRAQVRDEFSAQIAKVKSCLKSDFPIRIDSHQHVHMIPFISDIVLELCDRFAIQYIRTPYEPFFWHIKGVDSVRAYCGRNMIKHVLLKKLAKPYMKVLRDRKIGYCDYFIGVLFTGDMSRSRAESALRSIPVSRRDNALCEVLFHPGMASPGEEALWPEKKLLKHYYSPARMQELSELKKRSF